MVEDDMVSDKWCDLEQVLKQEWKTLLCRISCACTIAKSSLMYLKGRPLLTGGEEFTPLTNTGIPPATTYPTWSTLLNSFQMIDIFTSMLIPNRRGTLKQRSDKTIVGSCFNNGWAGAFKKIEDMTCFGWYVLYMVTLIKMGVKVNLKVSNHWLMVRWYSHTGGHHLNDI